jgi:Lysozyme like domain
MAVDPPAPAPTATTYTYAQLEGLWVNAGGPAAVAPVAAAIAEAESGGNPLAAYPGTTVAPGAGSNTDATGLWQILGVPAGFTTAQLTDPAANAQMAVAKYKGAGNAFTPWVTYTNGAYTAFLNNSTTPDTAGLPAAAAPGTSATTTAVLASASSPTCALSVPIAGCLMQKSALRGLIGGLCLGAAGIVGLAAAVILAASAFEHSGAATAVTQSVAPVRTVVRAAGKLKPL